MLSNERPQATWDVVGKLLYCNGNGANNSVVQIKVGLDEQETTINLYPKQVQDYAEVYSCIPTTMRKLRRMADSDPDLVRIVKEDGVGLFAQVPLSWIIIRKPKQVQLTDEQRAATAARLAAARAKRGGGDEA